MKNYATFLYESILDRDKTDKELSQEQKDLVKDCEYIVSSVKTEKSEIGVYTSYIDKYDTLVIILAGGLNGPGKWKDYFEDLTTVQTELNKNGIDAWMIDAENDCPDDVFDFRFGVRKKDNSND